jgi:hypothetical protein
MPKKVSQKELNRAISKMREVRNAWLRRPGVAAVDVGYKIKDGKLTDEVAVRVHVKRKRPLEELPEAERFPERLDEVSVDVIEADYGPQRKEPT